MLRKTWLLPSKIPDVHQLLCFVQRDRPLLIRFPSLHSQDWVDELLAWLKEELPEHYTAFDAGSTSLFHRLTVMQLISEDEVLAVADALTAAARQFAADASRLARIVAETNGIEPEQLAEQAFVLDESPPGWELFPHGRHLRCTDSENGQEIEIFLADGGFGMLDAEFFCRYLETTPGLSLPESFTDPYADMQRAFDILEKRAVFKEA